MTSSGSDDGSTPMPLIAICLSASRMQPGFAQATWTRFSFGICGFIMLPATAGFCACSFLGPACSPSGSSAPACWTNLSASSTDLPAVASCRATAHHVLSNHSDCTQCLPSTKTHVKITIACDACHKSYMTLQLGL